MSIAANQAKTRWNANNYVQIKVSVLPDIAENFKVKCQTNDVSMASVISKFMTEYAGIEQKNKSPKEMDVSTRKKRRQLVNTITSLLEQVRDAEESYRDNIPANLQGSVRYEDAENSITVMDEIIELLGDIY